MTRTRAATLQDLDFMWSMLFHASHADKQPEMSVEAIKHDPFISHYLNDWGREGDLGLIAERDGTPIGATWLRLFAPDQTHLLTYVAPDVPELVIAVSSNHVGEGIGSLLLTDLLAVADHTGTPAVVLDTRSGNPAIRLYRRHGFVETDRIPNRIGTESVKMVRQRPSTH